MSTKQALLTYIFLGVYYLLMRVYTFAICVISIWNVMFFYNNKTWEAGEVFAVLPYEVLLMAILLSVLKDIVGQWNTVTACTGEEYQQYVYGDNTPVSDGALVGWKWENIFFNQFFIEDNVFYNDNYTDN
jgi:hypothetical protein